MRSKWITVPAFLAGLLALATVDSQGQPPGFGGRERGGDGDRGRSGRGFDPEQIWGFMARGQDSINLNDPQHARTRQRMMERGEPIPPNGILTKQQFVASMQQRMAQGGFGGPGGGPGRFSPPGSSPSPMTFQATPGPDGKPVVMMQGGPPGMGMPMGMSNNPDEAMQTFFRMSDRNQDGRLDRDEVRGGLRERFEQYDANRDGTIDANEYKPYIQERMASRGGDSRGPGSFDPRNGSPQFPGGPGGWSGGPPGSWGGDQSSRNRTGQEEEERPTVARFGKLPKGLPGWFEEYDADQDGQVGLYEWRRKSKPTTEFVEMDLDADGYLTAGEWLRHQSLAIERRASESASESGSVGLGGPVGRGGPGQGGGTRFQFQPGGAGGKDRMPFPSGGPGGKDRGQPGAERNGRGRGDSPRPSREEREERKDGKQRDEKKKNPFTGN